MSALGPMTAADGTILRHGASAYSNLGCRCAECRADWSAAGLELRRVRAQRIAKDPSLRPHGVATTYTNWGCRCSECCAANTARNRRLRPNKTRPPTSPAPVPSPTADEHDDRPGDSALGRSASQT